MPHRGHTKALPHAMTWKKLQSSKALHRKRRKLALCNHCAAAYAAGAVSSPGKDRHGDGFCPYCGASTFMHSFRWRDVRRRRPELSSSFLSLMAVFPSMPPCRGIRGPQSVAGRMFVSDVAVDPVSQSDIACLRSRLPHPARARPSLPAGRAGDGAPRPQPIVPRGTAHGFPARAF